MGTYASVSSNTRRLVNLDIYSISCAICRQPYAGSSSQEDIVFKLREFIKQCYG